MHNIGRGQWSSRIGFIFAAAGSAIGLGNIWKFPGKVGAGGGGAYIIIYILIIFTIGISVMLTELTVGRHTQLNTVGALRKLNKKWSFIGYVSIISGFIVLSYYNIIGGQVLRYMFYYLGKGQFPQGTQIFYDTFISHPWHPLLWGIVFLTATALIVMGGVSGGIEKANKIFMPALFLLLILVMIHSLKMPGAAEGVKFLTTVDFSSLTPSTFLSALGQSLFSLSIGLGTTCTYGSYLKKNENLLSSTVTVCILDTLIAIVAAFTIIPAVFATGIELGSGGTFAFVALPYVFSKMSAGGLYGFLFFLLLSFAALTSSISLLEGIVAVVSEEFNIPRIRATALSIIPLAITGAVYSLSQGALDLKGVWYTFKDGIVFPPLSKALELYTDNILIPLSALGFCVFTAWIWGSRNASEEITQGGMFKFRLASSWRAMIKYVAPAIIIFVFIFGVAGKITF